MTGPWWDSGQVFLQSGRGESAKCLAEALWQMVPLGSLLPLEIDAGASSNWNAAQAGSSILVAIQSVSTLPVAPPGGSQ